MGVAAQRDQIVAQLAVGAERRQSAARTGVDRAFDHRLGGRAGRHEAEREREEKSGQHPCDPDPLHPSPLFCRSYDELWAGAGDAVNRGRVQERSAGASQPGMIAPSRSSVRLCWSARRTDDLDGAIIPDWLAPALRS